MLAAIKVYACYGVKIYKNKPLQKFKQEGAHPVRQSWIHLQLKGWVIIQWYKKNLLILIIYPVIIMRIWLSYFKVYVGTIKCQ